MRPAPGEGQAETGKTDRRHAGTAAASGSCFFAARSSFRRPGPADGPGKDSGERAGSVDAGRTVFRAGQLSASETADRTEGAIGWIRPGYSDGDPRPGRSIPDVRPARRDGTGADADGEGHQGALCGSGNPGGGRADRMQKHRGSPKNRGT